MPDPLSLLGVHLQIFIGPTLPIPAPYAIVDSLTELTVTNSDQKRDGFQMTFTMSKDGLLDYSVLLNGTLDPPNRIIILVLFGANPEVLIDGIITTHQFVPSNKPGETTLVVTGEDISLKLDLEDKYDTYPNQPDSVIVMRLLAPYATLGLVPQVTPTTYVPIQLERIPTRQKTDLKFIQKLAMRNGFVFYIEPTAPFVNTAYWGPDKRLGLPQHALTMNMNSDTNIESLSFSVNALGPTSHTVTIVEPITKIKIKIPAPSGLRPPLAMRPIPALRETISCNSARLDAGQAALKALAKTSESSDAVTGTGELDGVRYGHVLRARKLVGVRGVGLSYDGNYYVKEVTHRIKVGEYKQSFTLTREGLGSLTPVVVP